ncbi:ABC transporter permease [Christensenella tenuis]|uniref:ABC transporter permease n=1 Tax=Christensenella tenuis TaxID=2763033 RepID=A0ABR7EH22_9FIRM|nr:ABC transporter permease [Christensenella tenuis]MBC5648983.1 ABC transporter permease [Christensenella tenuis]
MGTVKRAILYIMRKRGRTLLLFAVLLVSTLFLLCALAVSHAAANAGREYRETLGTSLYITHIADPDDPRLWETIDMGNGSVASVYIGPTVNDAMLTKIMEIDGVTDYFVKRSPEWLYTEDLKMTEGQWAREVEQGHMEIEEVGDISNLPDMNRNLYYACSYYSKAPLCFGGNDSSLYEYFRSGAFELTDGRHITPEDSGKALISDIVAERSGLSVGDTFRACAADVAVPSGPYPLLDERGLEIVGIYHLNFKQEVSEFTYEDQNPENFVFVDDDTIVWNLLTIAKGKDFPLDQYKEATIFIEDPLEMDRIIGEIRALEIEGVDMSRFMIEPDSSAYEASAGPLETMQGLSAVIVILSAVCCLLVLSLLLMMWIRGRKREIGILMANGITKGKIFGQLLLEILLVTVAGLICAALLAGALSGTVGNAIQNMSYPGSGQDEYTVVDDQYRGIVIEKTSGEKAELAFPVTTGNLVLTVALMCGATAASVGIASAKVLKMKPRDILNTAN